MRINLSVLSVACTQVLPFANSHSTTQLQADGGRNPLAFHSKVVSHLYHRQGFQVHYKPLAGPTAQVVQEISSCKLTYHLAERSLGSVQVNDNSASEQISADTLLCQLNNEWTATFLCSQNNLYKFSNLTQMVCFTYTYNDYVT